MTTCKEESWNLKAEKQRCRGPPCCPGSSFFPTSSPLHAPCAALAADSAPFVLPPKSQVAPQVPTSASSPWDRILLLFHMALTGSPRECTPSWKRFIGKGMLHELPCTNLHLGTNLPDASRCSWSSSLIFLCRDEGRKLPGVADDPQPVPGICILFLWYCPSLRLCRSGDFLSGKDKAMPGRACHTAAQP